MDLGIALRAESCHFLAVLVDKVRSRVGIELANGSDGDVAHGGVAELDGENAEACGSGGVVVS